MSDVVLDIHMPKRFTDDQITRAYERLWKQPEDRSHDEMLAYVFDYPNNDMSDADALLNHINWQADEIARLREALALADLFAGEVREVWRTTDLGVDQFPWDGISGRFHEYQVARAALDTEATS